MLVEELHKLSEISQRSSQSIHLIDDDDVDLSRPDLR